MVYFFLIFVHLLDVFFIVFLLFFLDVALLFEVSCRITTIVTLDTTAILLSLIRVQELVVDVVNLTLHLLIGRLHKVHEHIEHAKCVRLLLQGLSREDRVEGAIDMSSHLQVIMLHHVG